MKHVVVDLETFSTRNDAAIVSIGAVAFDPDAETFEITDKFSVNVALQSSLLFGGHIDPKTVEWWKQGDPEVRLAIMTETVPLPTAFSAFEEWLSKLEYQFIWARGAHFDITILENACRNMGRGVPWNYRMPRDLRTLHAAAELAGWTPNDTSAPAGGVAHISVDDAAYDAALAHSALRHLARKA